VYVIVRKLPTRNLVHEGRAVHEDVLAFKDVDGVKVLKKRSLGLVIKGDFGPLAKSKGKVLFADEKANAYILDGTSLSILRLDEEYARARLLLTDEGLIACKERCALYKDGKKVWETDEVVDVLRGFAFVQGRAYVPHGELNSVLVFEQGKLVKRLQFDCSVNDVKACGKYLAVSTDCGLHLMSLEGKALWSASMEVVAESAFSEDCTIVAAAEQRTGTFHAFWVEEGKRELRIETDGFARSVDWLGRTLYAVDDERVYVTDALSWIL